MSRIDANREIYETWPIETRQAVLDGKAEAGMTPEMVEMALGKPTEITARSGPQGSGQDEIWIYRKGGDEIPDMTANSGLSGVGPGVGLGGNQGPGITIGRGPMGTSIGGSLPVIGGGVGSGMGGISGMG